MIVIRLILLMTVYLIGAGTGFMISQKVYSMTPREMVNIYHKLVTVNHLKKPPHIYLSKDNIVNGWTSEEGIVISRGALKLSKSEMAHLLGHELAHYNFNDPYWGQWPGKMQENRADIFGWEYAEKIGYSHCEQASIYLKFLKMYGNGGGKADPHSSNRIRYERLIRGCH